SRRNAEFRKSFRRCCAKTLVFVRFSAILSSISAMLDSNLQVSAADGNVCSACGELAQTCGFRPSICHLPGCKPECLALFFLIWSDNRKVTGKSQNPRSI